MPGRLVVTFSGTALPCTVQIEMNHDGTGTPCVANPAGCLKSVACRVTHKTVNVLLMLTRDAAIEGFGGGMIFHDSGRVNGPVNATVDPVPGHSIARVMPLCMVV